MERMFMLGMNTADALPAICSYSPSGLWFPSALGIIQSLTQNSSGIGASLGPVPAPRTLPSRFQSSAVSIWLSARLARSCVRVSTDITCTRCTRDSAQAWRS